MTAAGNEPQHPFFPVEIVSEGSRSAFHRGPELTGLGVIPEVFVARPDLQLIQGTPLALKVTLSRLCQSFFREFERLFQLRVFRFRSDEDGNVGVGVFPEREEILIGRAGLAASVDMA
jgi:hypothetical protein